MGQLGAWAASGETWQHGVDFPGKSIDPESRTRIDGETDEVRGKLVATRDILNGEDLSGHPEASKALRHLTWR